MMISQSVAIKPKSMWSRQSRWCYFQVVKMTTGIDQQTFSYKEFRTITGLTSIKDQNFRLSRVNSANLTIFGLFRAPCRWGNL
jgi:hypothetical protein